MTTQKQLNKNHRRWLNNHKELHRHQADKWKIQNRKQYNILTYNWRNNHPIKRKVQYTLYNLFKSTGMKKERCAICNSKNKIEFHHPNYRIWWCFYFLCHECHMAIHKKYYGE